MEPQSGQHHSLVRAPGCTKSRENWASMRSLRCLPWPWMCCDYPSPSSCCCDFTTERDCNLELWTKINSLSPKLLLVRIFYHSNRIKTRTWTKAHSEQQLPLRTVRQYWWRASVHVRRLGSTHFYIAGVQQFRKTNRPWPKSICLANRRSPMEEWSCLLSLYPVPIALIILLQFRSKTVCTVIFISGSHK